MTNPEPEEKIQCKKGSQPQPSENGPEGVEPLASSNEPKPSSLDGSEGRTSPNCDPESIGNLRGPECKSKVDEITDRLLTEWREEISKNRAPEPPDKNCAIETSDPCDKKALENKSEDLPTRSTVVSFYLHHPSLPSPYPVLIPIQADATLSTILTNRLILEFPTIFVLHQQPDEKLPEGYISEADFFEGAKKESAGIEELEEGEVKDGEEHGEVANGRIEDKVDEKRLMEVLGKDLSFVKG